MLPSFVVSTCAVLLAVRHACAHTLFTNFYIDGEDQGHGVCMRMNRNGSQASFPVPDIESNDIVCGIDGTKSVSRVCQVPDGSTLTFHFQSWANDASKPILDPSHKGPCALYMKKVNSAIHDSGVGDGWFKLWDDGYDEDKQEWCTNKLTNDGGYMTVKLPKGLVGGAYLVRPELLALHNALGGDPQFYVGCAQVFIDSPDGTLVPSKTVSIPGYVKYGQQPVSFNIYQTPMALPYPIPGPDVTDFEDGGQTEQKRQVEGKRPAGCIMENDNWCGFEVPSYSDETGCWDAGTNCWDQGNLCFNSSLPTGNDNCKLWQDKCKDLNDQCKAKNFVGPPNKGKDLTPKHTSIGGLPLYPTVGGGQTLKHTTSTPTRATPTSVLAKKPSATYKTKTKTKTKGAALSRSKHSTQSTARSPSRSKQSSHPTATVAATSKPKPVVQYTSSTTSTLTVTAPLHVISVYETVTAMQTDWVTVGTTVTIEKRHARDFVF